MYFYGKKRTCGDGRALRMNSEAGAVWLVRFWDGLFLGWFVFEMVCFSKVL